MHGSDFKVKGKLTSEGTPATEIERASAVASHQSSVLDVAEQLATRDRFIIQFTPGTYEHIYIPMPAPAGVLAYIYRSVQSDCFLFSCKNRSRPLTAASGVTHPSNASCFLTCSCIRMHWRSRWLVVWGRAQGSSIATGVFNGAHMRNWQKRTREGLAWHAREHRSIIRKEKEEEKRMHAMLCSRW